MAGKPELSAATGLQNVVVYVSDANFGQTYAVGQQNVSPFNSQTPHNATLAYTNSSHSLATVEGATKTFPEKIRLLKPYSLNGQFVNEPEGYFSNNAPAVISENGFPQSCTTNIINNITEYQNINVNNSTVLNQSNFTTTSIKNLVNYGGNSSELSNDKPTGPARLEVRVREDCDIREGYSSADSGYVSVMGGDGPCQSVRCDSVRSETAESSCSSLSSADEGLFVIQPQRSEMVVYDGNVSVRPGGVVLAVGSPDTPQVQSSTIPLVRTVSGPPPSYITIPYGWKRMLNNGVVIYISPNNTVLSSLEQVKDYLLTPGTCKCGLECPLKYDSVFNFDSKVFGKPWTLSQDTSSMDLNKLCNHKRKLIAMVSLGHKQSDSLKFRKDFTAKRKKRRIGSPYSGVSVSQLLAQRDKLGLPHPVLCKGANSLQFSNQMWPNGHGNNPQPMGNREYSDGIPNPLGTGSNLQFYRYQNQEASVNRVMMDTQSNNDAMNLQTSPNAVNISRHHQHSLPQSTPPSVFQHAVPNYMKQCDVQNSSQIQVHQQHIMGSNGQIISLQNPVYPNIQHLNNAPNIGNGPMISNGPNGIIIHDQNLIPHQESQQKLFINGQPIESSGPGRPNIQTTPIVQSNQHKQEPNQRLPQQAFCNESFHYQGVMQQFDASKNIRTSIVPGNCNIKSDHQQYSSVVQQSNQMTIQSGNAPILVQQKEKPTWQNRSSSISNTVHINQPLLSPHLKSPALNSEERVPPLYHHTPSLSIWSDDVTRKKVKISKNVKKRPFNLIESSRVVQVESLSCSNIDVRQQCNENERTAALNESMQSTQSSSSPSFMEDPSGYLAQQTALLNSTISRQTGMNSCGNFVCTSPVTPIQNTQVQHLSSSELNEVPLPSNIYLSQIKPNSSSRNNQNLQQNPSNLKVAHVSQNSNVPQQYNQTIMAKGPADSTGINEHIQCQVCIADTAHYHQQQKLLDQSNPYLTKEYFQANRVYDQNITRSNSHPNNPSSSSMLEDPVTSSTYMDKQVRDGDSPDSRPIQGGTVSTSNISAADCSQSEPSTPNPHTPTTPQPRFSDTPQINSHISNSNANTANAQQMCGVEVSFPSTFHNSSRSSDYGSPHHQPLMVSRIGNPALLHPGVITTMASGRTVSCNTITSVLAGRANTSTVSVNSPANIPITTVPSIFTNQESSSISSAVLPPHPITVNTSKSPLEMVQSVVSSIQVPQTHSTGNTSMQHNQQMSPLQIVKHSPTQGFPPGHILVSSGGQLIMTSGSNGSHNVMPPPLPKIVTSHTSMPPISVSPMITNVTGAVTQVIPAVAQQVLGQQTVLVNTLPAPFMLQPGVTMTMDGMAVAPNVQIPHLVAGNVIHPHLQVDSSEANRVLARTTAILSPDAKKKGKKRKMPSQTIASMLQYASQQNSGVVMSQPSFPQQIQMAHSPQGLTSGQVMQALTIVPGKTGGPTQILMNGQSVGNAGQFGTQQLIANSNQTQQINLLQPVNLINSTTGMVQNFPTIQQFIVPNLGGMVMNADGTATILPDTSNLGMHLQLQNVNGQNVLTPIQNNNVFGGGQGILAAGPAGMVIRTPNASQGKIIQQQHSPGAQFLSPNGNQFVVNGAQFSGQLSPLIANVNPTQVTFSAAPQSIRPNGAVQQPQPEFIQCGQVGQTLVVPAGNITVSTSNQQNTTFVQQNTTIVQQQTTMVSNNQHLQNLQANTPNNQNVASRTTTLNVDQNLILNANENRSLQAVLMQGQNSQMSAASYRHSVSTQTAVNQNNQAVTTNTFCQTSASAGSPPDTTTLSPLAQDVHRPPTADTTTHMENTDEGLSPSPSNSHSCSVAMVDCISSSEPDSAESNIQGRERGWPPVHHLQQKLEFTDVSSGEEELHTTRKSNSPIHMEYPESSTVGTEIHYGKEHINLQESMISSKNCEKISNKQKHGNLSIVPENRHIYLSLFQDEKEIVNYPTT